MARPYCAAGQVPVVRLALAKQACMRAATPINNVDLVIDYVHKNYGCMPQEYMLVVALDSRMAPLALIEASVGAVAQALVDPKVVFSALLLAGATAFMLFHNHPSGDPEPSQQDVDLTRQMQQAGRVLGMQLVDHIVIGAQGRAVSFMARGLLRA